MIKINLFKTDNNKNVILHDTAVYDAMSDWLGTLSGTKRGYEPYRICSNNGPNLRVPFIIFTRREDAVAFRLKFGL